MSRWAEWWFGRAVRLLPRALRREYGADINATFAARAAEQRGAWGRLLFTIREVAGVLRFAAAERLAVPGGRRRAPREGSERKELGAMEHLHRELRHAARRLGRTPGFTTAAVLTLALAIGANTAIFTVLHRVVLSPLPYPDAERLVAMNHSATGLGVPSGLGMTSGLYREYGELPSIAALALYRGGEGTMSGAGTPERLAYVQATPSLLQVLGVQPALGRWFAEEEASPEGDLVVVLSHALWVNRFGADPKIVGGTTRIDGAVYEVIGVMPESFAFPDERGQFYIAQKLDPAEARPGGFNYEGIARLKPGVTVEELTRQFAGVIAQLPEQFPEHLELAHSIRDEAQLGALPLPFKERVLGGVDDTLWVLLGAVGIVLLIACANLANLFLVRTESRQREIAVRRALGAGTRKIVGYYLSETLLVAFASGLVGLLSAYGAVQVLVAHAPVALPRLQEIRVGPAAAGYALLLAMLAGASFAVLPMLRRLPAVSALLKEGGRGSTAGVRPMRARQTLMAAQVALAVMLLVAAALVMQSFMALRRVDPGFRAESRLVFRIGLPPAHTPEATIAFHEQLLARLGALPGVESAAVTTTLPLEGWGWGDPLDVRGRTLPPGDINPVVAMRRASPGIFETLGTPLRSGRRFTAEDMRGHTNAAIINEALAARYFPGGNALGQQVRPMGQEGDSWFTIVGVVANTVTDDLVGEPAPQLYLALRTAITDGAPTVHAASYVVRSEGSPTALIPAVRRLLDEIDPELAIARPEPMTDMVMRASATTAFTMVLLVIAGLVAVTLGLIGVYAVIAYAVAQRTGEIGLRLALGARPHDVTSMIVGQSGMVIAIGVVLGLAGAAVGTRALQSMLYGVAALDALTFASVAVGLFAVALAACWVPAQKASRLSPLQSLRGD